jgi:hypothetical protein
LMHEVPPFVQSTSIILWAFAGAMVILAGAEWCARATVVACADDAPQTALKSL